MADHVTERIRVGDVSLHVFRAGPTDGPLVVLLHGFPELAYSWRAQIPALAAAGFSVVAPDLRGHGASDCPPGDAAYTMRAFVDDVVGLIDVLNRAQAFVVGHDWGARTAWAAAARVPGRIPRIIAINSPWSGRSARPPTTLVDPSHFSFLRYFTATDTPAKLDADVERTVRFFHARLYGATAANTVREIHTALPADADPLALTGDATLPPWLTVEELRVYVEAYGRTGFGPALARYRNLDADWATTPDVKSFVSRVLYLGAERDSATILQPLQPMLEAMSADSRVLLIPGAGHSLPLEKPDVVNRAMIEFLA
jgi:pimeloyl-ACP methyl ester carboxylesterase